MLKMSVHFVIKLSAYKSSPVHCAASAVSFVGCCLCDLRTLPSAMFRVQIDHVTRKTLLNLLDVFVAPTKQLLNKEVVLRVLSHSPLHR